ncbi:MAG: sensor histidine kinase, partial [Boseongicola sp. SB0677_bin_26]|nr:sensor histidine kinase [Boseongicola sp. SB0677_bin_26]
MSTRSFTIWLLLTFAGAILAFWISHAYFRTGELDRADARLSLYRSTLEAELMRFSHLTFILARDPFVIETAKGASTGPLDERLAKFAERAGIDAIYLMDADGLTRSASNAGTAGSFVGHNYSFRPYFKSALLGLQGRFYGIGATTGIPGYFYADAVVDEAAGVLGVVALKIDLSDLQESWRKADERVLLANADGVVLLASVPEWRYRTLAPLTPEQRARIADARQFGTKPLDPLDWSLTDRQVATIGGEAFLHLQSTNLPNDWSIHYFASGEQAETHGWLAAGGFLLLAALTGLLVQLQRTRKIDAALRRSEEEEAQ